MGADPRKSMGEFLPYLLKNGGVGPDTLQNFFPGMPEDKVGYRFPYTAKSIGTVGQNAQDTKNSAGPAPIAIVAKQLAKWLKGHWMTVVKTQRC
jgi:hypothetical protein